MMRLTREQVRQVDRLAIERYHIPGIVLMENAARGAAEVACEMLHGDCVGEVLIVCGPGNNGGDGLAIARHLHNLGSDVTLALLNSPENFNGDARINYEIAKAMGLEFIAADASQIAGTGALLIIDAIFGIGLSRSPAAPVGAIIDAIERARAPVLSVDVPSGLDCDTGQPLGPCVRAERTVTFVAEKIGFAARSAAEFLGLVTVADVGCPREVIDEVLGQRNA